MYHIYQSSGNGRYTYQQSCYIDQVKIGGNEKAGSGSTRFPCNWHSSSAVAKAWEYGDGRSISEGGGWHAYWKANAQWPWGYSYSHTFSSGTTVTVYIKNNNDTSGLGNVVISGSVPLEYSVAYNANGGTSTTPATQYGSYNTSITLAPAMTRSVSASRTTSISYNSNGGSGTMSATSGTQTGTTTYPFSKWALNSTSGTQYNASGSFTIPSSNSTMYAIWGSASTSYNNISLTLASNSFTHSNGSTSRTVTINYNANGGSGTTSATTASQSGSYPYNFSKWALGSTSGTQYTAGTSVSIASSTTAYAI